MPQMRSFGSFLPAPNLAQSYGAGVGLAQRDEELEARVGMEREKLANDYAMAEMATSARKAALQQEMLQKDQELEVEKMYRQQQVGLRERELQMEQQKIEAVAEEAAQQFEARQAIQQGVEQDLTGGRSPAEAFARNVALHGAAAQLPGSAYSDIIQQAGGPGGAATDGGMGDPEMVPVEGAPEGYFSFNTGKGSRVLVNTKKGADLPTEAVPLEGDPTRMRFGRQTYANPQYTEMRRLEKRRDDLETALSGPKWKAHRQSLKFQADGKRLTKADESRIKEWASQQAIIRRMDAEVERLKQKFAPEEPGAAALPPGLGGGSTTNQVGRFKVIR